MSKMTNYRKAWTEYRRTNDYRESSAALKKQGIKQPYRNNILQSAFAVGWNASGVEIKFIEKP